MLGKASPGRCRLCGKQEQSLFSQLESSLAFFGLLEALLLQVKLMELDVPQVHICDPLEFIFPACQSPLLIDNGSVYLERLVCATVLFLLMFVCAMCNTPVNALVYLYLRI